MLGSLEVEHARLALSRRTGDGGCAIGAASRQLLQSHLPLVTIGQSNHRHSEVEQIGNDGEQRHFLPAMLRRRGREGASDLAVQRPA
jgi:hypothetical protein